MTPEAWPRVKEIFAAARERTLSERAHFLDEACGTDAELRAEVESLLTADTGRFLETGGQATGAQRRAVPAEGSRLAEAPGRTYTRSPISTPEHMPPIVACPNCGGSTLPGARFCSRCGFDVSGPQGNLATAEIPPYGALPADVDAEILERLRSATLGEYDIIGELGRGGMAIVYLAQDIALDRKVAIKVMNPALLIGTGMSERFKREARTAAALTHPNIISIHLVREADRLLYFVMKYVEGRGLDSIIAETGPLPVTMALTVLHQAATALGYAHRHGVVHRDVKPANILIDSEGWVVVTDFGIAKVAEAGNLTTTGMAVGTPNYMSPEQCSAKLVTGASDQYSLGIVGFEMLAGRTPFTADSLMEIMRLHFFEPPPPLTSVRPDCPPALAAAIERMLAKEPGHRWPSIEDAIASAGEQVLGPTDSTRARLIELARTGIKPVARISTPVSPTPLRGSAPPKAAIGAAATTPIHPPRAVAQPRGTPVRHPLLSRRRVIWGAVGAVVLAAGAATYTVVSTGGQTDHGRTRDTTREVARAVASVTVEPATQLLKVGDTATLLAVVRDASGRTLDRDSVTWSSDQPAVVSVSRDGIITAVAVGSARVVASHDGRSATVQVTVIQPRIASLEIDPPSWSVRVRGTVTLKAAEHDSQGRPLVGRQVVWSSRTPGIAKVSSLGVVTGIAPGVAAVEASVDGITGRATITVTPRAAVSVTVTPAAPTIAPGSRVLLTAVVKDSSGQPGDGLRFSWSSSNPVIASVSTQGVVSGLSQGRARITATTEGGASGSAAITVGQASPGVLQVVIAPTWADITMDGQSFGKNTRLQLSVSSGNPHVIRFDRVGYATVDTSVTVQAGDTLPLRILMKEIPTARLQTQIQPWAHVSIDNSEVGTSPFHTYTLPAGVHKLRFERDGYVTVDTTVTLRPGETQPLQIIMRRTP